MGYSGARTIYSIAKPIKSLVSEGGRSEGRMWNLWSPSITWTVGKAVFRKGFNLLNTVWLLWVGMREELQKQKIIKANFNSGVTPGQQHFDVGIVVGVTCSTAVGNGFRVRARVAGTEAGWLVLGSSCCHHHVSLPWHGCSSCWEHCQRNPTSFGQIH